MVIVRCPCVECVNNGDGLRCKADSINLKFRNMATVNEGRVDMWVCDKYELSEWGKKIDKGFEKLKENMIHDIL